MSIRILITFLILIASHCAWAQLQGIEIEFIFEGNEESFIEELRQKLTVIGIELTQTSQDISSLRGGQLYKKTIVTWTATDRSGSAASFRLKEDASIIVNGKNKFVGIELVTDPHGNENALQDVFRQIASSEKVSFNKTTSIHQHIGISRPGEMDDVFAKNFNPDPHGVSLEPRLAGANDFIIKKPKVLEQVMKKLVVALTEFNSTQESGVSYLSELQNEFLSNARAKGYARPVSPNQLQNQLSLATTIYQDLTVLNNSASTTPKDYQKVTNTILEFIKLQEATRYYALNVNSVFSKGTIELRLYDGSKENMLSIMQRNSHIIRSVAQAGEGSSVFRILKTCL